MNVRQGGGRRRKPLNYSQFFGKNEKDHESVISPLLDIEIPRLKKPILLHEATQDKTETNGSSRNIPSKPKSKRPIEVSIEEEYGKAHRSEDEQLYSHQFETVKQKKSLKKSVTIVEQIEPDLNHQDDPSTHLQTLSSQATLAYFTQMRHSNDIPSSTTTLSKPHTSILINSKRDTSIQNSSSISSVKHPINESKIDSIEFSGSNDPHDQEIIEDDTQIGNIDPTHGRTFNKSKILSNKKSKSRCPETSAKTCRDMPHPDMSQFIQDPDPSQPVQSITIPPRQTSHNETSRIISSCSAISVDEQISSSMQNQDYRQGHSRPDVMLINDNVNNSPVFTGLPESTSIHGNVKEQPSSIYQPPPPLNYTTNNHNNMEPPTNYSLTEQSYHTNPQMANQNMSLNRNNPNHVHYAHTNDSHTTQNYNTSSIQPYNNHTNGNAYTNIKAGSSHDINSSYNSNPKLLDLNLENQPTHHRIYSNESNTDTNQLYGKPQSNLNDLKISYHDNYDHPPVTNHSSEHHPNPRELPQTHNPSFPSTEFQPSSHSLSQSTISSNYPINSISLDANDTVSDSIKLLIQERLILKEATSRQSNLIEQQSSYLAQYEQRCLAYSEQLKRLEFASKDYELLAKDYELRLTEAQKQVLLAQRINSDRDSDHQDLAYEVHRLRHENEKLIRLYYANTDEKEKIHKEMETLKKQASEGKQAISTMEKLTAKLEEQVQVGQDEAKRLRSERDQVINECKTMDETIKRLQERISTLEGTIDEKKVRPPYPSISAEFQSKSNSSLSCELGPLKQFLTIETTGPNEWICLCKNHLLQKELEFSVQMIEFSPDSPVDQVPMVEYVPLNVLEKNRAADPSTLPDFLRNVIYFPVDSLAPFLAKMIVHLYKAKPDD